MFFLQIHYTIIETQHCVYLRCSMCWFDTLTYYNTIATVALANISIISQNYYFFFVVGTFKIYSLCNFLIYNTLLWTITTMLCIRFLDLFINKGLWTTCVIKKKQTLKPEKFQWECWKQLNPKPPRPASPVLWRYWAQPFWTVSFTSLQPLTGMTTPHPWQLQNFTIWNRFFDPNLLSFTSPFPSFLLRHSLVP